MSSPSTFALAPADRAPGDRGWRGRISAVVVVGAVVVLMLPRLHGQADGGTDGSGASGWSFQYSFQTGIWNTSGLVLSAGLLLCGGATLWLARTRRLCLLAVLLSVAGVGVLVWALGAAGARRLSPEMYREVRLGATESSITAGFGSPVSTEASAMAVGGLSLGCLVYEAGSGSDGSVYLFCFENGQLRVKTAA